MKQFGTARLTSSPTVSNCLLVSKQMKKLRPTRTRIGCTVRRKRGREKGIQAFRISIMLPRESQCPLPPLKSFFPLKELLPNERLRRNEARRRRSLSLSPSSSSSASSEQTTATEQDVGLGEFSKTWIHDGQGLARFFLKVSRTITCITTKLYHSSASPF